MQYEYDVTNYAAAVKLLSEEISNARKGKVTFKRLHEDTGLAVSTISKLYYRETRFPRYETIIKLMIHFGYRVYARPTNLLPMKRTG